MKQSRPSSSATPIAPSNTPAPSPEVRAILKRFCDLQRAKYGPEWKRLLAAEMAEKTTPILLGLFRMGHK